MQWSTSRLIRVVALLALAGCHSGGVQQDLEALQQRIGPLPSTLQSNEHAVVSAKSEERVADLLSSPLTQQGAIELVLVYSPAWQAMLANGLASIDAARQVGRLPNPIFSYERMRSADEREIAKMLSIGVLDFLTWPQRRAQASAMSEAARWQLADALIKEITAVRGAWVSAVAAEQRLGYAREVLLSAEASAQLARRMQAAGNFSRLAQIRQQLFESQARADLTAAEQESLARRESLIRHLGLDEQEAMQLQLPRTLPALPTTLVSAERVAERALTDRVDVALAEAHFQTAARSEGLTRVTSLIDLEFTRRRETVSPISDSSGTRERVSGGEWEIVLPLFDPGELRRGVASRRAIAAAHELEATLRAVSSHLRESFAQYRNSYQVAELYLKEVIPLRKQASEETLLRYNAMLIGVFELLADAREQRNVVMQSISAQEQFWLAEASLQAAMLGRPSAAGVWRAVESPISSERGH
jgi:outer membrane protein TolC